VNLTTEPYLLPRLRMSEAIPPRPYTSPWCAQEQRYHYFYFTFTFTFSVTFNFTFTPTECQGQIVALLCRVEISDLGRAILSPCRIVVSCPSVRPSVRMCRHGSH
jgi:hypothetical protein